MTWPGTRVALRFRGNKSELLPIRGVLDCLSLSGVLGCDGQGFGITPHLKSVVVSVTCMFNVDEEL